MAIYLEPLNLFYGAFPVWILQTCAAIEEELIFISAPSRLDYYKTGMKFEVRVLEKRKQLALGGGVTGGESGNDGSGSGGVNEGSGRRDDGGEEVDGDGANDAPPSMKTIVEEDVHTNHSNKRQCVEV